MRTIVYFLAVAIVFICSACNNDVNVLKNSLKEWTGKTIVFPKDAVFLSIADTIKVAPSNYRIKILSVSDAEGCTSCRLKLKEWECFIREIDSLSKGLVGVFKFISPKRRQEVLYELKNSRYSRPVCIDMKCDLDSLNHFPKDDAFNCFLLDEDNRVILIGDPIQNSRLRDLYIKTICERLGIHQEIVDHTNEFYTYLGVFNWNDAQNTTSFLHNTTKRVWHIDSLYTSCDCTNAYIDRFVIEPNDSALVHITYQADAPQHFLREVYLDINGTSVHTIFTIEGDAVEL